MATVVVRAEITGTVCKIVTHVGDPVLNDEPVMYVEAMKMEIPVLAPRSGRVTEIRVAEGVEVAEGEVLAILEL